MGSKLGSNGIYEGSRMILTEHREAYLEHMHNLNRREKPVLDDQELQLIALAIGNSYKQKTVINITLFEPFEDVKLTGIVDAVNMSKHEIKLLLEEDYQWIKISRIISADCPNLY